MKTAPAPPPEDLRPAGAVGPHALPGGGVTGAEIVRELPPETALAVWQALRSVLMWAAAEPSARAALFDAGAMERWEGELLEGAMEPALRYPLAVVARELGDPEGVPEQVAWACMCVTEWALERNAASTGMAFAEAAARALPANARYAWAAGKLLRTYGRSREAETWLRYAESAAVADEDWEAQCFALQSLGNLQVERGSYARAKNFLSAALRTALRHKIHEREGTVYHDLMVVTTYRKEYREAEGFARRAFACYSGDHEKLTRLAHDMAYLWMERGHYARALRIFVKLPPHASDADLRLRLAAVTARAAAACADEPLFTENLERVLRMVAETVTGQGVAGALVEAGLGAGHLGRWDVAEELLRKAVAVAKERGEQDVFVTAERCLGDISARRGLTVRSASDHRTAALTDPLTTAFLESLSRTGDATAGRA